jgi:hypothetical protein
VHLVPSWYPAAIERFRAFAEIERGVPKRRGRKSAGARDFLLEWLTLVEFEITRARLREEGWSKEKAAQEGLLGTPTEAAIELIRGAYYPMLSRRRVANRLTEIRKRLL